MDKIQLTINGNDYYVGSEVNSTTTLLEYLRRGLDLRGTKYMCLGGRCGACIVSVRKGPGEPVQAVNSCLVSVPSCHKWDITTIEAVGNRLDGYHPVQQNLADANGTQCGYCSPGWVMAMYSLLKGKGNQTMLEIEQSLTSNICRCTGYRPILDAFKSFGTDSPSSSLMDIEDLKICEKTGKKCKKGKCDEDDWCLVTENDVSQTTTINFKLKDGKEWYRVEDIQEIFKILQLKGESSYMLANGNTKRGIVTLNEFPKIIIDISGVRALKSSVLDQNLMIGGGMTITEMMNVFDTISSKDYFKYLKTFNELLKGVAHIPVRNIGTVAGNLMISNDNNKTMTDIFMLFETVGAQVTILTKNGSTKTLSMTNFMKEDMTGRVLLRILLPPLSNEYKVVVYKVAGKSGNAGTIVNAGFLYKLSLDGTVLECKIVYGLPAPLRATSTARYLVKKNLFKNEIIQQAMTILQNEIILSDSPPATSANYRKKVAIGLFYKSVLELCPPTVIDSRYKSGSIVLRNARPTSQSRQIFDTDPSLWPVNKNIPKVEALIQCSGEAPYTDDIPSLPREVFAAFVLSTIAVGKIENIDASSALELEGVVAFYTADDIPGVNSFTSGISPASTTTEEIFCDGYVKYFNQPIGLIVAQTQTIADKAAKLVVVTYSDATTPALYVKDLIDDAKRTVIFSAVTATETGTDIIKTISGSELIHGQYHGCMETLVCVSQPTEEGLEVYTATQYPDCVQLMTSRALNMARHKIDVRVRRLGGAFGYKISRAVHIAVACNLVVYKLNRPCRFVQSLKNNMRAIGKRLPCFGSFEIAVDADGVIQSNTYNLFEDNGYLVNEPLAAFTLDCYNNCYDSTRWTFSVYNTVTDTASNTWCRSPGSLESIAMAELIMERISYEMSLDPIQVRLNNLDTTNYSAIKEMIETLKTDAQYTERKAIVDQYNIDNRWKKRGLRLACMIWNPFTLPNYFDVNLSVYTEDGTVVITHGGTEMGQGINTKAAQICAYKLGIDVDKVQVKTTDTINSPNNFVTGASTASGSIGIGTVRCCDELLSRLAPIKLTLDNPTWIELVQAAFESGVDLQTHGFVNLVDNFEYHVHGVALAEVEIDALTGESEILRVDLLEDAGRSISPGIDIGQIEGGFIMGVGYWTSEKLVYDATSGELLTDSFNTYLMPQANDIPQDFRIYLRKNSYTNDTLMGSKATGEPATSLAVVVPIAIRAALVAARSETGISSSEYFDMESPCNVERIYLCSGTNVEDFKLY